MLRRFPVPVLGVVVIIGLVFGAAPVAGGTASVTFSQQVLDDPNGDGIGRITVTNASVPGSAMTVALWKTGPNGSPTSVVASRRLSSGSASRVILSSVSLSGTTRLVATVHVGTISGRNLSVTSASARVGAQVVVGEDVSSSASWFRGQDLYYPRRQTPAALFRGTPVAQGGNGGVFQSTLRPGPNDYLYVNTSGLRSGNYFISDDRGRTAIVEFAVFEQTIDANWSANPVNKTRSPVTELTLSSNRASFPVVVSAPDLSGSEIDTAFVRGTRTGASVRIRAMAGTPLSVNTSGLAPGRYTFRLHVPDTGVSVETTLAVRTASAGFGVGRFAGTDGVVQTGELRRAISAWVAGDIDTSLLRQVISAWVTG